LFFHGKYNISFEKDDSSDFVDLDCMYWPAVNYLVPSVFQYNNFLNQVQIRYASWIYGSESMFLTDLEQKIRLAPKVGWGFTAVSGERGHRS
jgi:hypothetical protein